MRSCWDDRCDWQALRYHASQRHVKLAAHAVQAFEDTLLPAGLCERAQTQRNVWLQIISMQSWGKTTNVKLQERMESQIGSGGGCDGDQSRQSDLSFAHVGQRLFEMLRRSRRMAGGQLTGINKQKRKECYRTMEDRKIWGKIRQAFRK